MRFFRASEAVYESVRHTLNEAWGLPDGRGTETCFLPASVAVRDSSGRCLLAVDDSFCQYSVAVALLPQLLDSGAVEEISAGDYWQAFPSE